MTLERLMFIIVWQPPAYKFMITCTFEKGFVHNLRHVVVHALVVQNNSILLAKRTPDILEGGKWNIPGGFLDRDETTAAGALRELKEETGWDGEIIALFHINSKPNRPGEDRQNVVFEYLIKPLEQTGSSDWESSAIAWVPFDKLLPFEEYAFDHGQSLKLVRDYFQKPFLLPIID
jgi:ADP-ribose pyrophosphatase YjhB (NUDIX family)